jgi:hypothetical protein
MLYLWRQGEQPGNSPNSQLIFLRFYLATLNKSMKKKKDLLTHKQFAINCRANANTKRTDDWLASQGVSACRLETTPVKLLLALQQATVLLTGNPALLDPFQREILMDFKRRMGTKRLRDRLKESAAFPVFNISKKINRQIFKQHRQLIQA